MDSRAKVILLQYHNKGCKIAVLHLASILTKIPLPNFNQNNMEPEITISNLSEKCFPQNKETFIFTARQKMILYQQFFYEHWWL